MVDQDHVLETNVLESPVVHDGVVSVIAGETLHLEAAVAEDGTVAVEPVDLVANPDRTITISFGQIKSQDGTFQMVLKVAHPFKKTLKYRAAIHRGGAPSFAETTVCPVAPGITSYESWPDPIVQLLMRDLRLLDNDQEGARVCQ